MTTMASPRGCQTLGFLFLALVFTYGSHLGLARKIVSDDILLDSKRQLSEEYPIPNANANAPMSSDGVLVPELVKEDSKGSLEVPHGHGSSSSGEGGVWVPELVKEDSKGSSEVPHDHVSSTSKESTSSGDVKVNCGCPACAPAAVIPNCPSNCPSCGGVPAYYPPQPAPGCHTEPLNPPQPAPMNPPQPEPLNPPQPGPVYPTYPCPSYQPNYPPQVNPGCQPASPAQPEPTYPPQINPGCQPAASPPQINPGCQPATPQPEPTYPPQPEPNYPPQPQPNYPPQPEPNYPPQPEPNYPPQPEPTNPPQPAYPPQPKPTYPPWPKPSYPPKANRNIPPPLDGPPRSKLGCSLVGGCKSTQSLSDPKISLHESDIDIPLMNEESWFFPQSSASPSMNEVQVESIYKDEDNGSMSEHSWSGPPHVPPSPSRS